jgi:hypothetical protein
MLPFLLVSYDGTKKCGAHGRCCFWIRATSASESTVQLTGWPQSRENTRSYVGPNFYPHRHINSSSGLITCLVTSAAMLKPYDPSSKYLNFASVSKYLLLAIFVLCILVTRQEYTVSFLYAYLVQRSKNAWSYTSTPPIRLNGVVLS